MYRRKEKVEEQIPSWRSVVLCAEALTAFGTDSSLTLRMTGTSVCNRFFADARNDSEDPLFQILRFAQDDIVLLLRMTMYCCSE